MILIQFIFQIPVKLIKLLFNLVVAVMRIYLGIFGFLMPRPSDKPKSKMGNYAKEAWVKSGK